MKLVIHGVGHTLVSTWEQNILNTKSWEFFCRKRIYMLRDLKVSSLASKCVLDRLEHNSKGGIERIEFWWSWNTNDKWSYFSHLLYELYPLEYFTSTFQDLQSSVPWGLHPFYIMFRSIKQRLTCQIWHFRACSRGHLFFA